MILEPGRAKLIDFGLCTRTQDQCKRWVGSLNYASPEILLQRPYSPAKADVWSLGIVFYIMTHGAFPFVQDLVLRLRNELPKHAMRAICSDNGTEFKNARFDSLCCDLGLEHQFSSPYVPP